VGGALNGGQAGLERGKLGLIGRERKTVSELNSPHWQSSGQTKKNVVGLEKKEKKSKPTKY